MTLKVGKGNKYIGVHHSPANFCGLHILTATHRNLYIVAALQPVGNKDVAAGVVWIETILVCGLDMVQSVLSPAHIQRIAVRQKRLPALILHQICHHSGPVGPQICLIPRFAKVHLDCDIFVIHIYGTETGCHDEARQHLRKILPHGKASEICKINLGFFTHMIAPECI